MLSHLQRTFPQKLGLGLGMDMQWGSDFGFEFDDKNKKWKIPQSTQNFLCKNKDQFAYSFSSLQPLAGHGLLSDSYVPGLREFYDLASTAKARALHHTFLNLASFEDYDRGPLYEFTNEVTEALGIHWINEDVGIWSVKGKSLPYPLPPFLTKEGLDCTVKNVLDANRCLTAPLLLEFPGFTDGASFSIGTMHPFDFFYELLERTQNGFTLDTGHIIGWQWLQGRRGQDLYDDLERLPLDAVFEIHLSGCGIVKDRFFDYHHGVIMNEQIDLLEILLKDCKNLRAVTYEDPKYLNTGELIPAARVNFDKMQVVVEKWSRH